MKDTPRRSSGWLRFFAFFIVPVLVLALANHVLLKVDAITWYTFRELESRDDIDLAVVGSSVVFNNVNPQILTDVTGMEAFDVSAAHLNMTGAYAATKYMYKTNSPEYVVLILDQETLIEPSENLQAQQRLLPQLNDPLIAASYLIDNCLQDGQIIERLLMFKSQPIHSLDDLKKRRLLEQEPQRYYEEIHLQNTYSHYMGRGYARIISPFTMLRKMEFDLIQPDELDAYDGLRPQTTRKLKQFKALCERHGSTLIVVMSPTLTTRMLSHRGVMEKNVEVAAFCDEQDIPFLDFTLAKPDFMRRLDACFYDWNHLNGEGSDLYSERLGTCIRMLADGQSVEHLFYDSMDAYLSSIDFITNAYVFETTGDGQDTYTAGCNCGAGVTPEYRFAVRNSDGSMTVLRDYDVDPVFTAPAGAYRDAALCVYARPYGKPQDEPVRFELTVPRRAAP